MPEAKAVKVLIVDAHPLFIRGLAALIESKPEYKVAGEASTPDDALTIAKKEKPNLAIMEINLGDESGMDLITRLKSQNPDTAILVLSTYDERCYAERVLRLGARGYVMKTEPAAKVLDAVKAITSGKVYVSDAGESPRTGKDWSVSLRKLSDRELQVFSCIGKGLGTGEIARKFDLSVKTVDSHKEHLKLKFNCNSSRELTQLAIEWANHPGNP